MIEMEISKPISLKDTEREPEYDLNKAIEYINSKLILRDWHYQIIKVKGYNAIILSPYGEYIKVMDRVVEKFKSEGWDCKWSSAYDARGPHYCFYVSESHF